MANQKPIAEVRTGAIKATIWKNSTENGARFKVTFNRLYKDGNKWKSTSTFGRDDLLLLAKVADQTRWCLGAITRSKELNKQHCPYFLRSTAHQAWAAYCGIPISPAFDKLR